MGAYATSAQLDVWLGTGGPADADRLLDRATELLDEAATGTWDVDTNGDPTDSDVAATLADAACAQVEYWIQVGESRDIGGDHGRISSGGASWEVPPVLAPRARRILTAGGLLSPPVAV